MKKTILLGLTAVAMFFVGCVQDSTNENLVESGVQPGELVEKILVFEEDTKLDRDGVTGKLKWSEGDKVVAVLRGEDGTLSLDATKYTVDHENNRVAVPENTAYVLYTVNAATLSGTTASFSLPATVNIATPEEAFDKNHMKGVVEGDYISFKNLLGYIKVPVKGSSKLKGVIVRTICRTTTEFFPIAGTSTLDLSKEVGATDGNLKLATNNTATTYLRYNYSNGGLDISEGKDLYLSIPAGEYANMGLTFITEEGSHTVYATAKHTVTRSAIKPISASPIDLAAHTPVNPVSLAGTTGNANEDYARCYMVPPTAGSYEFPCILADGVVLKGGVTAEIKWAEEAGMVYDFHYNSTTNKISFKTNGKKGNALVVLTTGGNGGDSIIWHWHIWITDTPKTLEVVGTNSTKYYLMDRVVGATWSPASVIEATSTQTLTSNDGKQSGEVSFNNTIALEDANAACGIHFQYQNCNPLPRVKSLDFIGKENISTLANTRCDVMYGFSQYAQYWSTSGSGATVYKSTNVEEGQTLYIHNGIRNPNYQYKISEGSNSVWILDNILNNKDVNSNNSLLSAEVKDDKGEVTTAATYRFWCSHNNNTHATMMQGKTAHDPCPPGYIIENYSGEYWYMTANGARKSEFGYARAKEDNASYYSGYKFYGMYYNNATDVNGNKVPLYWPCDGNRESCVSGVSGQYANCGYIYSVNTNNKDTFVIGKNTYGKACAVCYGECISSYKAPGLLNESAGKVVNSQAYVVRCRRGKF